MANYGMKELSKTTPQLEDFPPKFRKLGMFIINSGQLMTLKEAFMRSRVRSPSAPPIISVVYDTSGFYVYFIATVFATIRSQNS